MSAPAGPGPGSGPGGGGWVRIGAPAKVNPFLEVRGRRPDGYHEIETLLLAVDLCDVVAARRVEAPGVRLRVVGPARTADVPTDRRNLVVRAVEAALAETDGGAGVGLELELEKRVPSGAGLGGGSSDAAAALVALDRALGRDHDAARSERLLARLGSDCVFFESAAATGFALAKGRGEEVAPRPLADRDWSLVVVVPDVHCDTAGVYGALRKPLSGARRAPSLALERFDGTQDEVRAELFNRLEDDALRIHPELGAWRDLFDRAGARHFRMSGSGSAFFGVYRDAREAASEAAAVRAAARERGLATRALHVVRPTGAGWLDLGEDPPHRP